MSNIARRLWRDPGGLGWIASCGCHPGVIGRLALLLPWLYARFQGMRYLRRHRGDDLHDLLAQGVVETGWRALREALVVHVFFSVFLGFLSAARAGHLAFADAASPLLASEANSSPAEDKASMTPVLTPAAPAALPGSPIPVSVFRVGSSSSSRSNSSSRVWRSPRRLMASRSSCRCTNDSKSAPAAVPSCRPCPLIRNGNDPL